MTNDPKLAARVRVEKPILFSAPMIRAILDGRKTQTRRILKETVPPAPAMDAVHPKNEVKHPAPYLDSYCGDRKTEANPRGMSNRWCWWTRDDRQGLPTFPVRWVPGDRLWVRETWRATGCGGRADDYAPSKLQPHSVWYEADGTAPIDECVGKLRPSIFMPRWASRITLEVTEVRVERLHGLSYEDAIAEGLTDYAQFLPDDRPDETPEACARRLQWPQRSYAILWDQINGKTHPWESNPFVVALTFRRVANAD